MMITKKYPLINKTVARGIVEHDDSLLLVSEDGVRWHLPGGWCEPLEDITTACEREVFEETGLHVKAKDIVYLYQFVRDSREKYGNIVCGITFIFLTKIIENPALDPNWQDPDNNLITHRKFFSREELIKIEYYNKEIVNDWINRSIYQRQKINSYYLRMSDLSDEEILQICDY